MVVFDPGALAVAGGGLPAQQSAGCDRLEMPVAMVGDPISQLRTAVARGITTATPARCSVSVRILGL